MNSSYFALVADEMQNMPASTVMTTDLLFISVAIRIDELALDMYGCLDSELL